VKKKPGVKTRLFLCSLVEYRLIDIQPGNFFIRIDRHCIFGSEAPCVPCPPIAQNRPGSVDFPAISHTLLTLQTAHAAPCLVPIG
jgi:hypothetical protein